MSTYSWVGKSVFVYISSVEKPEMEEHSYWKAPFFRTS